MHAMVLDATGQPLRLRKLPCPQPGPDELLIKVPNMGQREECKDDTGKVLDEAGRCLVKSALDSTVGKEAEGATQLNQDETAAYKIVGTDAVGPVAGEQLRIGCEGS